MSKIAIRAEHIIQRYGSTLALDNVSISIGEGELFFLLGASGCGKTTLLRSIAGLERPDSGKVFFGPRDVTVVPTHKREAAMVFQSYALWPHMSVGENVSFGLEERGVVGDELVDRTLEALKGVHLEGYEDRRIDELSGGQQQRVALARALVVRPKCLLLDEPLSNLDSQLRLEMRLEVRRIVKEYGLTAVYVTHDQEEALSVADKIAVMAKGKVLQVGTPEDVYRRPLNEHVAQFIGAANFLRGKVEWIVQDDKEAYVVRVRSALGELYQGFVTDVEWRPTVGDAVQILVRPEAFRFDDSGDVINQMFGEIEERIYQGPTVQYLVHCDSGAYIHVSEMNPSLMKMPGDRVTMIARKEDVAVLKISDVG